MACKQKLIMKIMNKKSYLTIITLILTLSAFALNADTSKHGEELNISKSDDTIIIKNRGYSAVTIEFYVSNGSKWEYLGDFRIPAGRSVSYQIGEYERCSNYGYKKSDSYSNYISPFYSCTSTI